MRPSAVVQIKRPQSIRQAVNRLTQNRIAGKRRSKSTRKSALQAGSKSAANALQLGWLAAKAQTGK